jgi:hypothetical protein
MAHAYRSIQSGAQIIISDEPRPDLEALARWVSIPVPETAPKLTAAEKKTAKAEAEAEATRIAALAVHVGDSVKLTADALVLASEAPDSTPEIIEKATAWTGMVTGVRHDVDEDADVATFDDEPAIPIEHLEVAK